MLVALQYWGAKARAGINRWIQGLLPQTTNGLYCEPFAGMLSVLLNRPRSVCEIASDTNLHLINWWEHLRDQPDAIANHIYNTPRHRLAYIEAQQILDAPAGTHTPLERACAVTIVVTDGMTHSLGKNGPGQWGVSYGQARHLVRENLAARLKACADRVRDVQFESRDVVSIMKRVALVEDAVTYLDPPYMLGDTTPYGKVSLDTSLLVDLLRQVKGKAAISGYGDEWDLLGWERHEMDTLWNGCGEHHSKSEPRTEVLWTNYAAAKNEQKGLDFGDEMG